MWKTITSNLKNVQERNCCTIVDNLLTSCKQTYYNHKMNTNEKYICRVCFAGPESRCEVISDVTKEIFDALLINMNWDISRRPFICCDCEEIILRCLRFKLLCVDRERRVLSCAVNDIESKFRARNDQENNDGFYGSGTCTFCGNQMNCDVEKGGFLKQPMFVEMLPIFLPEKDFQQIKNHTTCLSCTKDLEVYFTFLFKCLAIEESIIAYFQQNAEVNTSQVNIEDLQYFLLQNGLEIHNKCLKTSELKRESPVSKPKFTYVDCSNNLVKTEREDEEYRKELNGTFTCTICPYVARREHNIKSHMVNHKDVRDIEMYKCEKCKFETKWKNSLKIHMLVQHNLSAGKKYKCVSCTYETNWKNSLKTHMETEHEVFEVKRYKCSICSYEAKWNSNLKTHMLIHRDA